MIAYWARFLNRAPGCIEADTPEAALRVANAMGDVQDLVPTFKNLPLADMLDAVITKEISALEKSIEAKDYKTFVSGYDKLTQACNACHQGTQNEFIVIQRPARAAFTNQVYDKRR